MTTRAAETSTLDDGTYDACIFGLERRAGGVALECTITSGTRRGDVVSIVTSSFVARDPLSLVGLACTSRVRGDEIVVTQ